MFRLHSVRREEEFGTKEHIKWVSTDLTYNMEQDRLKKKSVVYLLYAMSVCVQELM